VQGSRGWHGASIQLNGFSGSQQIHCSQSAGFLSQRLDRAQSGRMMDALSPSDALRGGLDSGPLLASSGAFNDASAAHFVVADHMNRTTSFHSVSNLLGPTRLDLLPSGIKSNQGVAPPGVGTVPEGDSAMRASAFDNSPELFSEQLGTPAMDAATPSIPADKAAGSTMDRSTKSGPVSLARLMRKGQEAVAKLVTSAADEAGSGGDGEIDSAAAALLLEQLKEKVQHWFAEDHASAADGAADTDCISAVDDLSAEVQLVLDAVPAGYEVVLPRAEGEGHSARTSTAPSVGSLRGQLCCMLQLRAAERVVGSVLVCSSVAQRDDLAQRARQNNIYPPRLGLIPPEAAAALCFSCSWSLAHTFADASKRPTRIATASNLLELCRVLEELHLTGYAVGSLTPECFVKAGPAPRAPMWHLNCLHSVLSQGAVCPNEVSADARWLAPEQAHFAEMSSTAAGAGPITRGRLIVDAATDMYAFGLIAFQVITQRSLWEGSSREDILAALTGRKPMPMHLLQPPANVDGDDARTLLPLIAPLLHSRVPLRPLAGEIMASLRAAGGTTADMLTPRAQLESPAPSLHSVQLQRQGTQPVRMCLALGKPETVLDGAVECVRARIVSARRVFLLEEDAPVNVVIVMSLADSAVLPIYPLRSTNHIEIEWGGGDRQAEGGRSIVEISVEEPLKNGKSRLIVGSWHTRDMLASLPSGTFQLHIFAQVRLSLAKLGPATACPSDMWA
jgi:hypothetical protein